MTSIAALQCVERDLIGLDDDVSEILHEFRGIQIMTGFEADGTPIFRTAERKITLRYVVEVDCFNSRFVYRGLRDSRSYNHFYCLTRVLPRKASPFLTFGFPIRGTVVERPSPCATLELITLQTAIS